MKKLLQVLNVLAFGAMVYVNYLANALPINGKTPGEISDSFPNLFVPAGITFSIWGVIYLLLLAYLIYQAKDLFQSSPKATPWFSKIGILFVLSCAANIGWLYAWHYDRIGLSLIIMASFLLILLTIYARLRDGSTIVTKNVKRWVHLPFSVYLGWITVALIANSTAYLVSIGWDRFGQGEVFWAIVMIAVATMVAQYVISKNGDWAYGLVIIWGITGIVLKQNGVEQNIVIAGGIAIGLTALSTIPPLLRSLKSAF